MSDHVYDAGFVAHVHKYLETENYPSTLFVDPNIDQIFDLDDATKVFHEDGTLQELGKSITQYNALDTGWFILDMQMLEISSALAGHQRHLEFPASLKPTKNTYVSIVNPLGRVVGKM